MTGFPAFCIIQPDKLVDMSEHCFDAWQSCVKGYWAKICKDFFSFGVIRSVVVSYDDIITLNFKEILVNI